MIISAPGRFTAGRVTTPGSLVDLLPTFMGLATGGDRHAAWEDAVDGLDGADLCPIIETDRHDTERQIHAEMLSEGILAPIFMIRQGHYKLVTSIGDPDLLYDLGSDPDEHHNLADDPDHADRLASLRGIAHDKWNSDALANAIRLSQKRRHLIRGAHANGTSPSWDYHPVPPDDTRWYRGHGNYNDWAMDYLPRRDD
jgi:choline-sulfatase